MQQNITYLNFSRKGISQFIASNPNKLCFLGPCNSTIVPHPPYLGKWSERCHNSTIKYVNILNEATIQLHRTQFDLRTSVNMREHTLVPNPKMWQMMSINYWGFHSDIIIAIPHFVIAYTAQVIIHLPASGKLLLVTITQIISN